MHMNGVSMDPPPSIARALDKVDELVARLQQLQNTIADTRHAVLLSSLPEEEGARHDQLQTANGAQWTQWSAPAQLVQQELSEIVAVAKRTTTNAKSSTGNVETHGAANDGQLVDSKSQLLDELEQSRFVTKPTQSMKVAKVKQSQKAWTLKPTKSKGAVMFPNPAYSPSSPPASAKNFRILNPFNNPSTKRNIGMALADRSQKLPLLGVKKRQDSPVKSLPALIDRLPSRTRPVVNRRPADVPDSSKSKELPYPPSYYAPAKDAKVSKRTGASSTSRTSSQPFKLLEGNASRYMAKGSDRKGGESYVKVSRAKSISPRRKRADKENLLADGSGKMTRSWSASSAAFGTGHAKNAASGQSMIQRAKVWVLGKQFAKSSRA